MAKEKTPVTAAVRLLRAENVNFTEHHYIYQEKGGTSTSARELGLVEHSIIKTLVMQDDSGQPLIILMHGDRQVSTKELARIICVKQVVPCSPDTAQKHTGYMVGGTSPFGTRRLMPLYMEESISGLEFIYVNGGKRGFLVGMKPSELVRVLRPLMVTVSIP